MTKTLSIDFDGTLTGYADFPSIPEPTIIHRIVGRIVKHLQKRGWYIILNTCREGREVTTAVAFCLMFHDFAPNTANCNAPWLIEKYGDCRKILADYYLDDRNIGLIGLLLRLASRKKMRVWVDME